MPLDNSDLEALKHLIQEVIHAELIKNGNDPQVGLTRKELSEFRNKLSENLAILQNEIRLIQKEVAELQKSQNAFQSETQSNFDTLFKQNEAR